MVEKKEIKRVSNKAKKNITAGVAYVLATFNNTRVTITDVQGNVISWSTSGSNSFKGAKKSTPWAAQVTAENAGRKAIEHGLKFIDVKMSGPGGGREAAVRALSSLGLQIGTIVDTTKIPHNGCRPKKQRRI